MPNFNEHSQKQEINLNKQEIERCNNASHYNAGDRIAEEAQRVFNQFDNMFSNQAGLTQEQLRYLDKRRENYKRLVEESYNENLLRHSQYVPVTVAGPTKYPVEKMDKRAYMRTRRNKEWQERICRFLTNTKEKLKELTPIEEVLKALRNGICIHGESIPSDDPYVIEKLEAKIYYHQSLQKHMKESNVEARKAKKKIPFESYQLRNNTSELNRLKERLKSLKELKENQSIQGFKFEGGEVIANYDLNRLQVLFEDKPSEELRVKLKARSFKWARSQGVWQRQLTINSLRAAKEILV